MNAVEKRKYARKDCFTLADYAVRGRVYRDFIRNISDGGAYIESGKAVPVGQEITLTFSKPVFVVPAKTSPEGQPIFITFNEPVSVVPVKKSGRVAWAGPEGFGVQFNAVE